MLARAAEPGRRRTRPAVLRALGLVALAAVWWALAGARGQPVEGYGGDAVVGDFLADPPPGGPLVGAPRTAGAVPVLLTSVFALSLAGLVLHGLASSGTLELSGQSQGILPILVVGAATDHGLLLVARYREELTRRRSPSARTSRSAPWRPSASPPPCSRP